MKEVIYIPLGTRCSSCSIIDGIFHKRKFALPFDWIDIPIEALAKFFAIDDIDSFCENYFSHENISTQRSLSDNAWFPHHLTVADKFDEQLTDLKNKFNRRLKRLYDVLKGNNDLVFLTTWGHVGNDAPYYYNLVKTINDATGNNTLFISVNLYDRDMELGKTVNFYNPLGATWEQYDIDVAKKLRTHELTKPYFT